MEHASAVERYPPGVSETKVHLKSTSRVLSSPVPARSENAGRAVPYLHFAVTSHPCDGSILKRKMNNT